jgi:hypothetical protein
MSLTSDDLNAFHRFAVTTISDRGAESLQELVDLWEAAYPAPQCHAENVAAIRAAIRDMENGDSGRSAHLVVNELRTELTSRQVS